MLPRELLQRIRRLEISTRKAVSDMLAGQYHSVFKGRGMAFSEVRPYQPGDEIRLIDWNVTARMREPFIKVFTEERELTVMLLVDVSASTDYGSVDQSKAEVSAEIAAQIAFSAIANNDRVGLVLFSDEIEKVVPPKKGKNHVLRLITEILTHKPKGRRTDIGRALGYLSQVARRRTVTFLISDFLTGGLERPLRIVAQKHDLVPVVVGDPAEQALPQHGLVEIEDPETGEQLLVDFSSPTVRKQLETAVRNNRADRLRLFKKLALDHVELTAGGDYVKALTGFFRARAKRLAS